MHDRLSSNIAKAWSLIDEDRPGDAFELLRRDRDHLTTDPEFADVWLALSSELPDDDQRIADARTVAASFDHLPQLVWAAANVLVGIAEDRPLDLPPPTHGVAHEAIAMIREALKRHDEMEESVRAQLYVTLGAALRMISYERDDEIEDAFRRAIAINDNDAWAWFNAGIFYKWRGKWEQGIEANRKVLAVNPRHEGALWNLAVCATAAGDTFTATEAYLALGLESRPGDDGLPAMQSIGPIKLRVSTAGVGIDPAVHDAHQEREYEHIWVAARSACHGEVISASLNDLPVDFGDVVLWDPAPVGYQQAGELEIPMFPLLARLREGAYHRLWFVAEQQRSGILRELGSELPNDVSLYVLDEQIQWLCQECSRGDSDIESHDHAVPERRFVTGKLLIPHDAELGGVIDDLYSRLDAVEVRFACPDLFLLANDEQRAVVSDDLWEELMSGRANELGIADERPDNRGTFVRPVRRASTLQALATAFIVSFCLGALLGFAALLTGGGDDAAIRTMAAAQIIAFIATAVMFMARARQTVCSDRACRHPLDENHEHCPGCGAALFVASPTVDEREAEAALADVRAEADPLFAQLCIECGEEECEHTRLRDAETPELVN